jgi:hypothetical protein
MKLKMIATVLLLLALAAALPAESVMLIEIENFSMEVPLGWLAQYTKSPTVFMIYSPPEENDSFRENCNLVVEALPEALTLQRYMRLSLDALRGAYKGLQVVESKDNHHVITGSINDVDVMQLQYFFVADRTAYVLTFTSTPADFEAMAGSFEH